ncbi:hypothetical protein HMPREF1554_00755 [Porphyromonas gingivalis F0569]|nr:hypothetical protein HMPREF1554_00755 [Porphyromonas gingivalis F0569]
MRVFYHSAKVAKKLLPDESDSDTRSGVQTKIRTKRLSLLVRILEN